MSFIMSTSNSMMIYYHTSAKSQFILSSLVKACATESGKAVRCPTQAPLVFCFFGQGSSNVKSSSSTSSFFALSRGYDDPSPAHPSA